ncbi:MAG: DUF998 domain-containing protein [Tepidisphaera sp.]
MSPTTADSVPTQLERTGRSFAGGLLWFGVAVPIVYYGLQVVGAMRVEGYSWVRNTASDLGSTDLPHHRWFNAGVMMLGGVFALAAVGYWSALRAMGARWWVAALVAAGLLGMGVQTAWAGWYPVPHPKHGGHPAFVIAMLATPVLISVAMWKWTGWAFRAYLVMNLLGLLAMVPIMSGMIAVDRGAYAGLLQRLLTATIFIPIAVAAARLMIELRRAAKRDGAVEM